MMTSAAWQGQDQHVALASDLELNQFLDMSGITNMADAGSMQFRFTGFQDGTPQQPIMAPTVANPQPHQHHTQPQPQPHHQQQQQQRQPHHHHHQQRQLQTPDSLMANSDPSSLISSDDTLLQNHVSISAHMLASPTPDSISHIDAQIHYLQAQKFQQQQQQQRQIQEQQAALFSSHGPSVPPTPQSLEMPPATGHFYSQPDQMHQHAAYHHNYQQRLAEQQDMAFTPLVSPAVTPLDPHFNMDHSFSVSYPYFSPLTSPALHAQPDSTSVHDYSTNSYNSPTDMDLETCLPTQNVQQSAQDFAKKTRRGKAVNLVLSKSSIKSSPITKPQRRKPGPSPAIVSQVLGELDERRLQNSADAGLLPLPLAASSTELAEENASVSPENLTDMPPPPVPAPPKSNSKSPYIQARNQGGGGGANQAPFSSLAGDEQQPHPATPASLMKLPCSKGIKKPQTSQQGDNTATDKIESLELPESVSNRPLAPMKTQMASQFSQSITDQSPSTSRGVVTLYPSASSAGLTPVTDTMPASCSPSVLSPRLTGPPRARKTPQLLSRNSRKCSSGSVQVSPALLPKISPNIKPLMAGRPGMSAEDTSRLLMSKSNYQNILEGNMVPGVNYPSELSTNVTSKRTSHKIAEQGRRNRINSALQIMAGLLPEPQKVVEAADDEDKKEDEKPLSGGSSGSSSINNNNNIPNSKASIVESAIAHMKNLQQENGDLKRQLEELKKKMEKEKEKEKRE